MHTPIFRRLKYEGGDILIPYLFLPQKFGCGHFGPARFTVEIDHRQVRFTAEEEGSCPKCELREYLKSKIICPRCQQTILKNFTVAAVQVTFKDSFVRDAYYLDSFPSYVVVCTDCVTDNAAYGWWDGEDFQEFTS